MVVGIPASRQQRQGDLEFKTYLDYKLFKMKEERKERKEGGKEGNTQDNF